MWRRVSIGMRCLAVVHALVFETCLTRAVCRLGLDPGVCIHQEVDRAIWDALKRLAVPRLHRHCNRKQVNG